MKKFLLAAMLSTCLTISAQAYTQYDVPANSPHFSFDIFSAGEYVVVGNADIEKTSFYEMTNNQLDALFYAAKKWSEYLKFDPEKLPTFIVYTSTELNAFATSSYAKIEGSNYMYTLINAIANNRHITDETRDSDAHGSIEVGLGLIEKYPRWSNFNGPEAVFKEPLPDIYSTMLHEMYHAIGLISFAYQHRGKTGDERFYFSAYDDDNNPISIWDKYLRIYQGDISPTAIYDSSNVMETRRGMSIKTQATGDEEFDIVAYSPYYAGPETMKALTGMDNASVEEMEEYIMSKGGLVNYSNYYSDSSYKKVLGLPINVIEEGRPELSHIELRNSFMSHQSYQNWAILMEAELAVLKDLGYNTDLRKYFGQSYYLDHLTENFTRGFGNVWDGMTNTYSGRSLTENGIGLHIYGSDNNITQKADILSDGKYTIGVRIDGTENTYTLNPNYKIDTAGAGSIGLTAMWGKNHTINLKSDSEVTATGQGGIAAAFDFGKNIVGGLSDDRGSYSNYTQLLEMNKTPDVDTQGPLVSDFNVAGTLEGNKASIYISENAYVQNINIINGSTLVGDIISEWNSVKTGTNMSAQIFDGTSWKVIDGSNPNDIYYTNLNFVGDGVNPYVGSFSNNIIGASNIFNTIKMNIDINGTLNFGDSSPAALVRKIDVYDLTNNGTLNIIGNTSLITQSDTSIAGNGTISVADDKFLELHNVKNIDNTLQLNAGELDTSNRKSEYIAISKLVTSDDSKLDMDLGDVFDIADTTGSSGTTNISSVYADDNMVKQIEEQENTFSKTIFTDKTVNLGDSTTNVYYNGKKYVLGQDVNPKNLVVKGITASNGISDAAADPKAANYIVAPGEVQNNDGGTVNGKSFEITGDNLDFNGNKGLIVDGTSNPYGTTVSTNVKGATEDANYKGTFTVQNSGQLIVETQAADDELTLQSDNNVIYLDDTSLVKINASESSSINIDGKIEGESNTNSVLSVTGDNVSLARLDNVAFTSEAQDVELNDQLSNVNLNLKNGTVTAVQDSVLAGGTNAIVFNGGDLNLQNGQATQIDLRSLMLNEETKLSIDVDIANEIADTFVFNSDDDVYANYGTINIADVKLLNLTPKTVLTKNSYIAPIVAPEFKNMALAKSIVYQEDEQDLYTPIFKYKFDFGKLEDSSLAFILTRGSSGYDSYNPAVVVAPVAAQMGGYLNQLNSYEQAFQNLDMKMLMTREERKALKMANLYASEVQPRVFSPTYLPEKDSAGWFRPYASFEKVNLSGGPKVESVSYGSYFGGDSKMYETKNGWDYQYSVYVGYNGSHQNYQGNSIYQNGGNLGATGIWYKGDFFTALTANVGASVADASTMYGSEDFPMLMTGVASKTGYNWELAKGKFIIQPSYLMSYTFVNTFDYTNGAGVRISSDPLHAINIAPGLKFIGNLKHGWQPYLGMQMVWNIMDDTHFKAQNVALPNMSVKPYFQYGVGVQKRWGERFTGFLQAMIRNGGRNGVALSLGFRWAIGK